MVRVIDVRPITWTAEDNSDGDPTLKLEVDGGPEYTIVFTESANVTATATLMNTARNATDNDVRSINAAGHVMLFSKTDSGNTDERYNAIIGYHEQPKDPAATDSCVVKLYGTDGIHILTGRSTAADINTARTALAALA